MQQVRHRLHVNLLFQAFGHKRQAAASYLFDVDSLNGRGSTVASTDGNTVRRFGGNHAREGAAIVGFQNVGLKLGLDLAVGIKNVQQHGFHTTLPDASQLGANRVSNFFQLVTSRTVALEDLFTALRNALDVQRLLILLDDVLPSGQSHFTKHIADACRDLLVWMMLQQLNSRWINVAARHGLAFDGIEKLSDPNWTRQERFRRTGSQCRTQLRPNAQ